MDSRHGTNAPAAALELADRLGARQSSGRAVRLSQIGVMRNAPSGREMRFTATQTIELQHPAFAWRARTGPLGCITVIDALAPDEANLEVRALGIIRIAGVTTGPQLIKGEIMRCLAELAWAPDAILQNPYLTWREVSGERIRVGCRAASVRAEVELGLDTEGRITSVFAPDRPRREENGFVERPWKGRFFDYRMHEGRSLPFGAEVGWILDGNEFVAWHAGLTGWLLEPQ